jgi:hypothetical protein
MVTEPRPARVHTKPPTAGIAVVIPIPNDPDWSIFDQISAEIPIIVVDDSDGRLSPTSRPNVQFFDSAAQRKVMGEHYAAIPHKSAACRNFGHYLAYREGFDCVIALDYDCRPRPGWLDDHLSGLRERDAAPALAGRWINTIEAPGFYSRGFPYEFRNAENAPAEVVASGEVKLNMGVWDNVLDLNGIDKLQREPPRDPGLRGSANYVALGNVPLCGMNTAFRRELVPGYFFLPDVWVDGWQLSRHDDIWGGYILKKLMDIRGDLLTYGRPIVEHTRQTTLTRVVVYEHYMHLMAREFYALVDQAVASVRPGPYQAMYEHFVEEFLRGVDGTHAPAHYRAVFQELGLAMQAWARCFR